LYIRGKVRTVARLICRITNWSDWFECRIFADVKWRQYRTWEHLRVCSLQLERHTLVQVKGSRLQSRSCCFEMYVCANRACYVLSIHMKISERVLVRELITIVGLGSKILTNTLNITFLHTVLPQYSQS